MLRRPLDWLAATVMPVVGPAEWAPLSSASLNRLCVSSFMSACTHPSFPGKPAPVRMAVAVFPSRLRSKAGVEWITDGRGRGERAEAPISGEPAPPPFD